MCLIHDWGKWTPIDITKLVDCWSKHTISCSQMRVCSRCGKVQLRVIREALGAGLKY